MSNFAKIVIVLLLVLSFFFIREKYGSNIAELVNKVRGIPQIEVPEIPTSFPEEEELVKAPTEVLTPEENQNEKEMVDVYFLALDSNSNGIYKKVQREVPEDKDKFEYAMTELIKGPNIVEKSMGAYSEIPKTTKLISIKDKGSKIIIDLNDDFQYGGGTDSIYSRMMQLIKTSLANTEGKKIYLYINGKQLNEIGGEGIMISQPLTEKSLD